MRVNAFGRIALSCAISAMSIAGANAVAAEKSFNYDEFYSALTCSSATISGGPKNTAAIVYPTNEGRQRLHFLRLDAGGDVQTVPAEGVDIPLGTSIVYSNLEFTSDMYWSRAGEFILWQDTGVWWADNKSVTADTHPTFQMLEQRIDTAGNVRSVPEHIDRIAHRTGFGNGLLQKEFDLDMKSVGNIQKFGGRFDSTAWAKDGSVVRVDPLAFRFQKGAKKSQLKIRWSGSSDWDVFAPAPVPDGTQLLLFRDNPIDGVPEAAIEWLDNAGVVTIALVKRGASAPETISSGQFERISMSPDRSRIYGTTDVFGQFSRLQTESHSPDELYWLAEFEKIEGIEKFYLLSEGNYALVQTTSAAAGTEISIRKKRNGGSELAHRICTSKSSIERVVSSTNSQLFIPKGPAGDTLFVYLHGGRPNLFDGKLDRMTDFLSSSGNPVLSVYPANRQGPPANDAAKRDVFALSGEEVVQAVETARVVLGSGDRRIVFVGDAFAASPGVSAILSKRISADGFIILSGPLNVREFFTHYRFGADIYGRTDPSLSRASNFAPFDAQALRNAEIKTKLIFIEHIEDNKKPDADIAAFIRGFNSLNPVYPARYVSFPANWDPSPDGVATKRMMEAIESFLVGR